VAAVFVVLLAVGCDKQEPTAPAETASPSASPATRESAAPGGGDVGDAAASRDASAANDARPPSIAPASRPADASVAGACGTKPLPDCPLQAWMKANTSAAIAQKDFAALETALRRTADFAPPGYPNWVSISYDGADAAKAKALDAVKASCRGCHDQYKTKYKQEHRPRPLP